MKYLLITVAILLTTSSCSVTETSCPEPQPVAVLPPDETTSCNILKQAGNRCSAQCPFGQPVYRCPAYRPCTSLVVVQRAQYELGYSPDRGLPLWVCETVDPGELQGRAKRKSGFSCDPLIPSAYQASKWFYTDSGFDRGHLAAAANQKWDQRSMNQTFYMSNVAPMHPKFNRPGGAWYKLEKWVRDMAVKYNEKIYIISGPSFYTWRIPLRGGSGPHGTLQEVHVPSHYWKVVVMKKGTDKWHAIGFTAANENEPHKGEMFPGSVGDRVNSIDNIEQITGLDLMPNLSPSSETELERRHANWLLWGGK